MKKYVIVGTGGRSTMFQDALSGEFGKTSCLAAICDHNAGRLAWTKNRLKDKLPKLIAYHSDEFDRMIAEHKPEAVIVCTKDATHDEYICRAMELGCDVITEKPMTTDEKKCQRIIDTARKTGKNVRVTFNYRYAPPRTQVKDLLMKGVIGKILSVEFQWLLDTSHGADYFRRWHRNKINSGGLMVHKATHHFDLVNWWLSSVPVSVFAEGDRVFYNATQAERSGLGRRSQRCQDCTVKDKCNYCLDMNSYSMMKELYLDCEKFDSYYRDKCVFSDEIDIEDVMNVIVKYKSGAFLSYSLNAFSPWEGYRIAFNGTKGRLEHLCQESSYLNGDGGIAGAFEAEKTSTRIYPHFKTPYEIQVDEGEGAHGGGDAVMLNDIFNGNSKDIYLRAADYTQGAYSILVGVAANHSMASGKKIFINDLVKELGEPAMPKMPDGTEKVDFVENSARYLKGERVDANIFLKVDAPE